MWDTMLALAFALSFGMNVLLFVLWVRADRKLTAVKEFHKQQLKMVLNSMYGKYPTPPNPFKR